MSRGIRSSFIVGAALAGVVLGLPGAASAATPAWVDGQGAVTSAGGAALAQNGEGDIALAGVTGGATSTATVRFRPAGKAFDDGLSASVPGAPGTRSLPSLGLLDRGELVAAWTPVEDGADQTPVVRERAPDGTWGAPQDIGLDPGPVTLLTPAAGVSDELIAAGRLADRTALVRWLGPGEWSAPEATPAPAGPATRVAVGECSCNGAQDIANAAVAWTGADGHVRTAAREGDGWTGPVTDLGVRPLGELRLGPLGDAALVWTQDGPDAGAHVQLRTRGGAWGDPVRLPGSDAGSGVDLVIDRSAAGSPTGTGSVATVLWTQGGTVRAARGVVGGALGEPVVLRSVGTGTGATASVAVGVNYLDQVVAVTAAGDGSAVGFAHGRDGGWSSGDALPAAGRLVERTVAEVVVDDAGNAAALVSERNTTGAALPTWRVYGYDAAGTLVCCGTIQDRAEVGQVIYGFGSQLDAWTADGRPLDQWSGPGTSRWDFGDGSEPASGPVVGHRYAKPGRYQVELTTTDALGFAKSTVSPVYVAGPENAAVDGLRVEPRALDSAVGGEIRAGLLTDGVATLELLRLSGGRLSAVSSIRFPFRDGAFRFPIPPRVLADIGPGTYVLTLTGFTLGFSPGEVFRPFEGRATVFTVG